MSLHRNTLRALLTASIAATFASNSNAATYTWDGTPDVSGSSVDTLVTTGTNWVGDVAPDIATAPGQDWIFANSAFTNVTTPVTGGRVNSITFAAGAPSYTISGTNTGANDLALPNITNLSSNLQTINDGVNLQGNTIKSTNGAIVFGGQYVYNNGAINNAANRAATSTKWWVTNDITLNAPLSRQGYQNVYGPNGTATTVADMTGVTGALILNSPTGTSAVNGDANWTGVMNIWSGAVRVGDSTALGYNANAANTFIHGTFAASTATVGQTVGAWDHGFGRLEVYNNINLTEALRIDSRVGDAADFDHIVNYSGDNTIAPVGLAVGGGGHFNISSTTGTLTLGSSFALHVSDANHATGGTVVNNIFTFRGAGNTIVNGNMTSADVGKGITTFRKQGTGTVTLGGLSNTWDGGTLIEGGTLAVSPVGTLSTNGSIIHVANNATLDVSAIGGVSFTAGKSLSGDGTVIGDVTLNGGTISPGGIGGFDAAELLTVTPGVGTTHLNNTLLVSDTSVLKYDLSTTTGGANDHVNVGGDLFLSGTVTFNISAPGGLGSGSYHLIDYTGTLNNSAILNYSGVSSGPRQSISIVTSTPNTITLDVSGLAANLTWVGDGGANAWQTNGPAANNWTGAVDNHFYDGDFVTFANSANTTIDVVGTVAPGGTTFTNTTNSYSITGSGTINSGNITISGSGSVSFSNSGGTIANNFTNSGSGNVNINGSSSLLIGGTLTQSGTGTTTIQNSGTLAIAGVSIASGGTVILNRTDNLTVADANPLSVSASGSGTFRKLGTNIVELTGSSSGFTGNIYVDAGVLKASNANALGGAGATVTVADGATLDLNGSSTVVNVVIAGDGVLDGGIRHGALTSSSTTEFAHINGLTLTADSTISTIGIEGATTRAIIFVDGFLNGNNHNLNVKLYGNAQDEVDLINNGETGLANINISSTTYDEMTPISGGALYIGGTTTLGSAPGTVTVSNKAKIAFYPATAGVNHAKPIVIAASGGGLEVAMSNNNPTNITNLAIASQITMNGDTIIDQYRPTGNADRSLTLSGKITGAGNLGIHASSTAAGRVGLIQFTSDQNDYSGSTTISGGFEAITAADDRIILSLGDGGTTGILPSTTAVSIDTSGTLRFNRSNVLTVSNVIANLGGGNGNVQQFGTGRTILTATNTYSGTSTVTAGTLQFANHESFYNNATAAAWDDTHLIVNSGATAAFNVGGGTNEFTETEIQTISALGTATGGFRNGSRIGFDTTNAGGNFTYSQPITNTNAGANALGVTKFGSGKLTLSNTSTYTGNTTVSAGTLDITGNHTTGANYSVATNATLVTNNVRVTNALTVDGTATINANGGAVGASKVETLTIGAGGKLDLKDNDLVVGTAVDVTAVRDQIKLGKTNNAPSGITSDAALFGSKTGFGYAMGNDPNLSPLLTNSSFLTGQSFDTNSVLVKYTFLGDADLDGDTDLNDLGKWASNFTGDLNNPAVPAKFWTQGDFDYDGDTDLNDLGKWSSNFTGDLNGGAGSLIVYAPGASASAVAVLNGMGITVVPEPSTFVLAGVGLAGLAIAARRKKRA